LSQFRAAVATISHLKSAVSLSKAASIITFVEK
jgi:hypothetical protein